MLGAPLMSNSSGPVPNGADEDSDGDVHALCCPSPGQCRPGYLPNQLEMLNFESRTPAVVRSATTTNLQGRTRTGGTGGTGEAALAVASPAQHVCCRHFLLQLLQQLLEQSCS